MKDTTVIKSKVQREIREKARLTYGLLSILKEDVDQLRSEAIEYDFDGLAISISDAAETLQKLVNIINDIEYALYLDKHENL